MKRYQSLTLALALMALVFPLAGVSTVQAQKYTSGRGTAEADT